MFKCSILFLRYSLLVKILPYTIKLYYNCKLEPKIKKTLMIYRYSSWGFESIPRRGSSKKEETVKMHTRCTGSQARSSHQRGLGNSVHAYRSSPGDFERSVMTYIMDIFVIIEFFFYYWYLDTNFLFNNGFVVSLCFFNSLWILNVIVESVKCLW